MVAMSRLKSAAFVTSKRVWRALQPKQSKRPAQVVIVGGVQRSGTNMLMESLDRSWDTDVYHETDSRAYQDYALRDLATITRLHRGCKAPLFVFKTLFEGHRVRGLMADFPGSKAVWMFRNYGDMINSHMVNWPGGREQIEDIIKDSGSAGYRGLGMTSETQAFVRSHYTPGMSDTSALALFWYYRNRLFFDQGLQNDPNMMVLRYEDVVSQPAPTFEKLCRHLGMTYRPNLHAHIHASSISKQRQPEIDAEIEEHCRAMFARLEDAARNGPA